MNKDSWLKYIFVFITISILLVLGAIYSPAKFFRGSGDNEGISLVRDDHELNVYYERIGYYFDQGVPFQNDRVEYPVLGLFYLTAPAIFTDTQVDYNIALIIMNLIFLLGLVIITYNILKILGVKSNQLWLLALPSFLYFTINRFDIFPALLIQLGILLLVKKKFSWAFLLLSFSFLAKGYAMVLFPIFFVYYLSHNNLKIKNYFNNKPFILFTLPVVISVAGLIIWAGFENALFPYIFQSGRNFAYGSIYGTFIALNWDYFPNVFWRWFMSIGSKIFGFLQLFLPLIIFIGYKKFKTFIKSPTDVIRWSLLVLMLYIFLSPYYSPQWFVWLLPLFILIPLNKKEIWSIIVFDLLNFLFFPLIYGFFSVNSLIFNGVVFARTIACVVLIILITKKIIKNRSTDVKN